MCIVCVRVDCNGLGYFFTVSSFFAAHFGPHASDEDHKVFKSESGQCAKIETISMLCGNTNEFLFCLHEANIYFTDDLKK